MKRCPECRRDYYDDSLLYCLDDGIALLDGPASMDEPATAMLPSTAAPGEAPTRAQIHTTAGQSVVLPSPSRENVPILRSLDKRLVAAPLLLAVLAVGGYFGYRYFSLANSGQIESIAVMPFVNESGNADVEYLSDGMTETLISSLTQVPNLSVKARSSVFRYKGKEIDPKTLGKELNVHAVLTGRVAQRGEQLTLSLELVDVETENAIWSQQYNRKQSDLVSLQSEIARDVSSKLKSKLTGADVANVEKNYTANPEAYEAYLRGRFYWNKRTKEGLRNGVEFFQRAVDKDPNYALAYVGLADCYALLENYTGYSSSESLAKAKSAADRALQIDESLAEAHASLGNIDQQLWLWNESEQEFRRSIELNPKYPTARHWYSISLKVKRRFDDALREIKVAQELDPLSSIISHNVGVAYLLKGELDSAEEQFNRVIDLDPTFPLAHQYLAWTRIKQGRFEDAIAEMEKAVELSGNLSRVEAELGYYYALAGRRDDALRMISELEKKYKAKDATAQSMAIIHFGLGEKERGFAWLERAFQERNGELSDITWRPVFDGLRDDPQYQDLRKRMGLPE